LAQSVKKHNETMESFLGNQNGLFLKPVSLRKMMHEDEWPDAGLDTNFGGLRTAEFLPVDLPSSRENSDGSPDQDRARSLEIELRVAQAEDHLHMIRQGLVEQANTYRKRIRQSPGNARLGAAAGTRAYAEVRNQGRAVRLHAQQYRVCRERLLCLGCPAELMEKYQVLETKHITCTTATYDAGDPLSQKFNLPWFWLINCWKTIDHDEFIADCKSCKLVFFLYLKNCFFFSFPNPLD
jgi:hypothetical protein